LLISVTSTGRPASKTITRASENLTEIARQAALHNRDMSPHTGTSTGRIHALQRLNLAFGQSSIGHAYDADCRDGIICYTGAIEDADLYRGVALMFGRVRLDPCSPRIEMTETIEVALDLHLLKTIKERTGTRVLSDIIQTLRPAIGWCLLANLFEIDGNFVVPTELGLWFCRRAPLPSSPSPVHADATKNHNGGPVSRIMNYLPQEELPPHHRSAWQDMMDAGSFDLTPKWPSFQRPSMQHLEMIRSMREAGLSLKYRTV
jgi:hypothetical protein